MPIHICTHAVSHMYVILSHPYTLTQNTHGAGAVCSGFLRPKHKVSDSRGKEEPWAGAGADVGPEKMDLRRFSLPAILERHEPK